MSRHRNVRNAAYDDYDYDDIVGSVTDEPECISPTDAKQWLFDRAKGQSSLDQFLSKNENIQEEEEDDEEEVAGGAVFDGKERRDSENYQLPVLNDIDKSKLLSCMEEIRNIIGETYSDKRLVEVIMVNNFDFNKALDMLLNGDNSRTNTATSLQPQKSKTTDTIEKDFKKISISNESEIAKQVPSGLKFSLPTFNKSVLPSGSSSKPLNSSAGSLLEFANLQLKNHTSSSDQKTFTLPKLFGMSSSVVENEEKNKKFSIDLTAALIPEVERKDLKKCDQPKLEAEQFVPQFIDCKDTVIISHLKDTELDDRCEKITLRELKDSFDNSNSNDFSIIGKIIRKKFRKKIPKIRHAYARHTINRFNFDTPSPDDQILAHLSKKKK